MRAPNFSFWRQKNNRVDTWNYDNCPQMHDFANFNQSKMDDLVRETRAFVRQQRVLLEDPRFQTIDFDKPTIDELFDFYDLILSDVYFGTLVFDEQTLEWI